MERVGRVEDEAVVLQVQDVGSIAQGGRLGHWNSSHRLLSIWTETEGSQDREEGA